MPRQEEPPVIMDEIPRTYYPGRGFLTDQEAYPTDLYGNVRPPNLLLERWELERDRTPQIIPLPYPVPMPGNQGNNQGGFNVGKALGAMAGYLGMGFGNPAFSPGPMLAGRYGDLLAKSPSFKIPGGQTPYRRGPYLPFRGEEKREEETPFIPLPVQQAQALPYGPKTPGRHSYPPGMEGVVDLTYPAGHPQYGQPMDSPVHPGRPIEMNEAEFEGLQRLRRGEESLPPSEYMKKYAANYVIS